MPSSASRRKDENQMANAAAQAALEFQKINTSEYDNLLPDDDKRERANSLDNEKLKDLSTPV